MKFSKHILKNGLRVILVPQASTAAATVLVLVEAGSEYETKEINGISHFLEHLCFKGTTNRANSGVISSELESLGAVNNAFTGQEFTGYYAKVAADKVDPVLEIISDLYLNPIFDEKELEKEKGVIIEEINMYEDLPARKVHEIFSELLYGDQPAGWPIGGQKDVIRRLTREDVVKYRSAHYVAKATVVVVAGNFKEKKTLSRIKELFEPMPRGTKSPKGGIKEIQTAPRTQVQYKASDQTHVVVGFRAFPLADKRRFALEILTDILGGGMSSRLFNRLREELGAAYYAHAGTDLFTDHGFLYAAAGIDTARMKIVIEAIVEEFKKLKNNIVSPKELAKSKSHVTGKLMLSLETSDALASYYGDQEVLREKIMNPDMIVKKIKAVTAKDVLNVAKSLIVSKHLNIALIGPVKELPHNLNLSID